jgi:hypothetical protein
MTFLPGKEDTMRTLTKLTVVTLAALTLGMGAGYAQTKSQQKSCGIETWNTATMHYESMPCTGQEPTTQDAKQPTTSSGTAKSNAAKCGVETWSTDKMAYETTPCVGTQ